jgi:hypothetical protein
LYLKRLVIDIYTHQVAWNNLTAHLLNDIIYPEYHKKPKDKPTLHFHPLNHLKTATIGDYSVLPVKVNHATPTLGYQITSPEGKSIFYTGDTGAGLTETWKNISPDVLFIEVTASNRWEGKLKNGHMTPNLLEKDLSTFHDMKGYFPHTIAVHLNPGSEKEIRSELEQTGKNLGIHILAAQKGMKIQL